VSPLKLRDVPGWEEAAKHAAVRLQTIDWVLYSSRIGNLLKTVGAQPAPAGLQRVTPLLVRTMVNDVSRDRYQRSKRDTMREARLRGRLLIENALRAVDLVSSGEQHAQD
jgi:hypothetical protein